MFTYYQAENSTAEPALVNAIEQGLRAQGDAANLLI